MKLEDLKEAWQAQAPSGDSPENYLAWKQNLLREVRSLEASQSEQPTFFFSFQGAWAMSALAVVCLFLTFNVVFSSELPLMSTVAWYEAFFGFDLGLVIG